MNKSDWEVFKSKFSDNPQSNFERMCGLLFCCEHSEEKGIPRYVNHYAIETDPISKGGEVIGWQAKFFDAPLNKRERDIVKILEKVNKYCSTVTVLYFYTNQGWYQGKEGDEPKGRKRVEEKADEFNIKIVWRDRFYFDSPEVVDKYEHITSHFFTLNGGISNLLCSFRDHTEEVLNGISNEMNFGDKLIPIDMSENLSKIKKASEPIIINGCAGVGKTALVKSLYQDKTANSVFYIHKATEFSISRIGDFLMGFSMDDFIRAHKGERDKTIVIDSAERLIENENREPFIGYIGALIKDGWKILFTMRNSFLHNFELLFVERWRVSWQPIGLYPINAQAMEHLSEEFNFPLPEDRKLMELICVPFYLNEYLVNYPENQASDLTKFKHSVWVKKVTDGHPQRGTLFVDIVKDKVDNGGFYIPKNSIRDNHNEMDELCKSGVIGYEDSIGYYITHDVYEEWALEKYIEREHREIKSIPNFFENLGASLPMRRAFKTWLSGKLEKRDANMNSFIRDTFVSDKIPAFWREEIIISILLSDHSNFFFASQREKLLENDCHFLRSVCKIILLGCKRADSSLLKYFLPNHLANNDMVRFIFSQPNGDGWKSLIKFIYHNRVFIGKKNFFNFVLPVISDWNEKNEEGETTRISSLLAFYYYKQLVKENIYIGRYGEGIESKLILTILNGVREISEDLRQLIDEIIQNKWKNPGDPYYALSTHVLTKHESYHVASVIPEKVIELAKFFWVYEPTSNNEYFNYPSHEIEHAFGIIIEDLNYSPSGAYQTPVYWLLAKDVHLALDFIIEFVDAAVEKYATSMSGRNSVEMIRIYLDEERFVTQYIDSRLWCLYRGTEVVGKILESIHMALESFLLRQGENYSSEQIEDILYHIISRTKSASLSSVVASIVMAFPDKTFRIAKILFEVREFFVYDTRRYVMDQSISPNLSSIYGDERKSSNEREHRKTTLEKLVIIHQFFSSKELGEEEANRRRDAIWEILDTHYAHLPNETDQSDDDKTWRLYLARMDRRRMSPKIEDEREGNLLITLNPRIDEDLIKHQEEYLEDTKEYSKYSDVFFWSDSRYHYCDRYKQYDSYETDPISALKEIRELWHDIHGGTRPAEFFDSSVLTTCAVLLRDFYSKMGKSEVEFCQEVVFIYAELFIREKEYNLSPVEVKATFSGLVALLKNCPERRKDTKYLMIRVLIRRCAKGIGMSESNISIIKSIEGIWSEDFNCALSIYMGYIILAKEWNNVLAEYRKAMGARPSPDLEKFWDGFIEDSQGMLGRVVDESIISDTIEDIGNTDINILSAAFHMLPMKTDCAREIPHVMDIVTTAADRIMSHDEDRFSGRYLFLRKYSEYILHLRPDEIGECLTPFIEKFSIYGRPAELFRELINAEYLYKRTDNFWHVWELFRDSVIGISDNNYWSQTIIGAYMFSHNSWEDHTTECHTFSKKREVFFRYLNDEFENSPGYLYGLSKLLCGPGKIYLTDNAGISWLASITSNSNLILSEDYQKKICLNLERIGRVYILPNREHIKRTPKLKSDIITILDFLVKNDSVVGYLLREDII